MDGLNEIRQTILDTIAGKNLSVLPRGLLNGRSFRGRDLRGINLRKMTLCNFDFSHADLRGACFQDSRLIDCLFSQANLTGADLRGVDGRDSDWRGAVLWNADLSNARNFNSAGAILGTARMAPTKTSHSGVDLSLLEWRRARDDGAPVMGVKYPRC